MYRHEAISIARQVMDRANITEKLQPWIVDAILAAVNGTTKPEPLPLEQLAMTREQANTLLRKHLQGPMDPVQFDARILDAVLEAANRAKPWATYQQPCLDEACPCISNTDDIVAGDPESPIPPLYPVSVEPPPPVGPYTMSTDGEVHANMPPQTEGMPVQVYEDPRPSTPDAVAIVINNNQPGWRNIIATRPHVTLPIGIELYTLNDLERAATRNTPPRVPVAWRRASSEGWQYSDNTSSGPYPSNEGWQPLYRE